MEWRESGVQWASNFFSSSFYSLTYTQIHTLHTSEHQWLEKARFGSYQFILALSEHEHTFEQVLQILFILTCIAREAINCFQNNKTFLIKQEIGKKRF